MRAATRGSKSSRRVCIAWRCVTQASTAENPPGALIWAISASSASGSSSITAPAADSRASARSKAVATVGSSASSTSVRGSARRNPATPRAATGSGAPASTPSTMRQSCTERVMAHTVSSVNESGNAPARGVRDCVLLKPTRPHSAAGMRIEPPVSEPSPATARPSATDTAAPEDEPPGMRATAASAGLHGVPWCGLMPTPEKANSLMFVRPTRAAPAARSRATAAASRSATGSPRRSTEPASVVRPAMS